MDIGAYFVTKNKIVKQYVKYTFNAHHFSRFATSFGGPCWPNDEMQVFQRRPFGNHGRHSSLYATDGWAAGFSAPLPMVREIIHH